MSTSKIEWTDSTWNPVTGCTKISAGCKYCYAERMSSRLFKMGVENYKNEFQLTLHPNALSKPLEWKKPKIIFVNSMSDLFHKDVPLSFIKKIFAVMEKAHWHTFQVLTKRAERLLELSPKLSWPKNVWMGVSVESNDYIHRAEILRQTDAKVKFLSVEPLIASVSNIVIDDLDWVIVGGESGPKAREMKVEWVREVRDLCIEKQVAFFFKQWGGVNKKKAGRVLDERTWDEMPRGESEKFLGISH